MSFVVSWQSAVVRGRREAGGVPIAELHVTRDTETLIFARYVDGFQKSLVRVRDPRPRINAIVYAPIKRHTEPFPPLYFFPSRCVCVCDDRCEALMTDRQSGRGKINKDVVGAQPRHPLYSKSYDFRCPGQYEDVGVKL